MTADSIEEATVDAIYDRLIETVTANVLSKLHKQIKTGSISFSDLVATSERKILYPDLYNGNAATTVKDSVRKYAVEIPDESSEMIIDQEIAPTTERSGGQTDIWGNIPAKEPRDLIDCPTCKRQVNTLRFAPHLDKCLGIGTMSRAATGTASSASRATK